MQIPRNSTSTPAAFVQASNTSIGSPAKAEDDAIRHVPTPVHPADEGQRLLDDLQTIKNHGFAPAAAEAWSRAVGVGNAATRYPYMPAMSEPRTDAESRSLEEFRAAIRAADIDLLG